MPEKSFTETKQDQEDLVHIQKKSPGKSAVLPPLFQNQEYPFYPDNE